LGEFRGLPSQAPAIAVTVPSVAVRVSVRDACSAASNRPSRSKPRPLAWWLGVRNGFTVEGGCSSKIVSASTSLNSSTPRAASQAGPSVNWNVPGIATGEPICPIVRGGHCDVPAHALRQYF